MKKASKFTIKLIRISEEINYKGLLIFSAVLGEGLSLG